DGGDAIDFLVAGSANGTFFRGHVGGLYRTIVSSNIAGVGRIREGRCVGILPNPTLRGREAWVRMGSEGMTWQSTPSADEAARVAYWQLHMERSHELLRAMERHPVQECGEPLASIPDAARAAGVEMYFSDTPCGGVFPRIYMIRTSLLDP